ncbi:SMI1/KNR4 family protein [Pelagibius sp.]|uniref:SMI1/KNR4 family protein n=1 Tax=Pelagibius sp. TaxID=1931238 RepID=UPI00260FF555|nr:SMI1/KNR4 family protein [Pelagibius sp.]
MDEAALRAFWQEMKETVRCFRKEDRDRIVFGARRKRFARILGQPTGGHDYRILPTVADKVLLDFERQNKTALPPAYRTYLQVFGAGGAGPNYGIDDFAKVPPGHDFSTPFPYRESLLDDDYYDWPTYEDGWGFPGLLHISDLGCACDALLELNGPQPGTVWHETEDGFLKQGRFADYYREWARDTRRYIDSHATLRSFANRVDWWGRYSHLKLDEILEAVDCEHHSSEDWSIMQVPEGEVWVMFHGIPGKVVVNDAGAIQRIDLT